MINNDFARILHFLEYVNEQIALRRAALILSLDERAFDAKELAYDAREVRVVFGAGEWRADPAFLSLALVALVRAAMEQLLWYLLAGTRGGHNRIRIIDALRERPYNAHQLSETLGLDYRTVRHHLEVLTRNHVLAKPAGDAYGSMYFLSGGMRDHMETFARIKAAARPRSGEIVAKEHSGAER